MGSGGRRPNAGRPAKGYVAMTVNVPSEVRNKLKELSEELQMSQGEVIATLLRSYLDGNQGND